jgi:D-glycero-alpha-D-manno-heptose 1-phosphate guanylyltransferase
MNTDFIILCGGQGTRLRSAIGESQKVMAYLGNEPFLDLVIKYIQKQGGRRVILSTGYKAQDVEAHYAGGRFKDVTVEFSREEMPLGTGGAIKKACGLVQTEDFFVLNGDSFCPVDFGKMLAFHRARQAQASVVVSKVPNGSDYGMIVLGAESAISAFQEKAAGGSAHVNAGIYCFKRGIDTLMPPDENFSLEKDFFPQLVGNSLYGFSVDLPFLDIGTPERYELAKKYLK